MHLNFISIYYNINLNVSTFINVPTKLKELGYGLLIYIKIWRNNFELLILSNTKNMISYITKNEIYSLKICKNTKDI